ncbi:unnamed protein product [Mytilus coruscus]|uniref:KCTD1_15 n=1 Tax=Mytilus coruscus TaxID=42192 RepID=A0A6J8C375_MYTCO|nr:unnamed protein product [Mytilus coruscus]
MSANTTAGGREGDRFGTAEDDDIDEILNDVLAKNTQKSTKFALKFVYDYCVSKGGQENLREMKPSDFQISEDDEGKEYVHKMSSEVTKNHQGVEEEEFEPEGGRIYATANLCKTYTNHCVRATSITVLSDSEFEARHIVTISGHRNEQSVQNYVRDTSTAQKRDMSASMSSYTAANSTTHLDQNNNYENMNNSIFDVNESDLTEAQYDNIFETRRSRITPSFRHNQQKFTSTEYWNE